MLSVVSVIIHLLRLWSSNLGVPRFLAIIFIILGTSGYSLSGIESVPSQYALTKISAQNTSATTENPLDVLSSNWLGELLTDDAVDQEIPCYYSGAFQQKRNIKGLPTSLVTLGRFVHDCQRGLIWEIQNPRQESLIYTRANKHFKLDASLAPVALEGRASRRTAELLLNLLGGNRQELEKQFHITKSNPSVPKTELTPRNATLKQFIHRIEVLGSERTLQISVHTVSNGLTTIDVANLQSYPHSCSDVAKLAGPACELLIEVASASAQ